MVNNFFKAIEFCLLPGQCLLCGAASQQQRDLCQACQDQLPWLEQSCSRCALPLDTNLPNQQCAQCLKQPPPFRRIIAPWGYRPPVSNLIQQFKYQRQLATGRVLGELMGHYLLASYLDEPLPDLITATPLHWWRQLRRGYNQSDQLAWYLSRATGIPLQNLIKRQRATVPQQGLDARQRQRNLKAAFKISSSLTGQTVAVVDDVVTTTATSREMAQCLLDAGAAAVDIWCLARTPSPQD